MERADGAGAGALEVVRLDAVLGAVHGERGRERDLLAVGRCRCVRVEEVEVAVDVQQQPFAVRPAGRCREEVTVDRDRCAVHDEGAGGGGGCRGAQVGEAAGG